MASITQSTAFVAKLSHKSVNTRSTRVAGLAGSTRGKSVSPRISFRRGNLALKSRPLVLASAADDTDSASDSIPEVLTETFDKARDAWEETDDKPAIVTLGVYGIVLLVGLAGVLEAVEGLPLIPNLLELVGIAYSIWFVYRYLLFKPDREELKKNLSELRKKIVD